MIKEAYCSYEISKLLKKKGFDERTLYHYTNCDVLQHNIVYNQYKNSEILNAYSAPTHQMACAWLREVYKLHIAILWDCGVCVGKNSFCYHIYRIDNYEDKGYNKIGFDYYEEAVEAALKYCLENLI